jgi:hypothetical protein
MKPIETWYKGHRFRSRLEARWAVFFDALQFRWEYEPQGYVLPNTGCYLPDFKVILPMKKSSTARSTTVKQTILTTMKFANYGLSTENLRGAEKRSSKSRT